MIGQSGGWIDASCTACCLSQGLEAKVPAFCFLMFSNLTPWLDLGLGP